MDLNRFQEVLGRSTAGIVAAWLLLVGFAGVSSAHAQSISNLLSGAQYIRLGGYDDHVNGVTVQDNKPLWFGFGWTTNGTQGRIYGVDSTSDVGWAADGVVGCMTGHFMAGTSNVFAMVSGGGTTNVMPLFPDAGALTPAGVNSNGVVVGYSFNSTPFYYSNGVTTPLATFDNWPGSAVAVSGDGTIVGLLFGTNQTGTVAAIWKNGDCSLLADPSQDSSALCIGGGRIGGGIDQQMTCWEQTPGNGEWISKVIQTNGVPIKGTIYCLTVAGYFGGTFQDGGACFGKFDPPMFFDLRDVKELPTSTRAVTGIAEIGNRLVLAVDCETESYGIIIDLGSLPALKITRTAGNVRITWPITENVVLESNTLLSNTGWQDMAPPYLSVENETWVELPITFRSYFRLRSK